MVLFLSYTDALSAVHNVCWLLQPSVQRNPFNFTHTWRSTWILTDILYSPQQKVTPVSNDETTRITDVSEKWSSTHGEPVQRVCS